MKKKNSFVIAAMLVIIMSFGGCGAKQDVPADNTVIEDSMDNISATDDSDVMESDQSADGISESEADGESEDMSETENTETDTEELEAEQTMEEWLTEVGSEGTICMAVWNELDSTKHIIENDTTYERQEGDRFFICTPSKFKEGHSRVAMDYKFVRPYDNYLEVTYPGFSGEEDITHEITCSGGEEGKIHFTLASSGTQISSSTTDNTDIPGFYWAGDLGYDTSKIVVWNDAKSFKQVLDEGATYQLCEGDELAVYLPENYIYNSSNIEGNLSLVINLLLIDVQELEIGEKLDVEITTSNTETSELVTNRVTLLPIQ